MRINTPTEIEHVAWEGALEPPGETGQRNRPMKPADVSPKIMEAP
jgi:hypothetical protein